ADQPRLAFGQGLRESLITQLVRRGGRQQVDVVMRAQAVPLGKELQISRRQWHVATNRRRPQRRNRQLHEEHATTHPGIVASEPTALWRGLRPRHWADRRSPFLFQEETFGPPFRAGSGDPP